MQGSAHDDALGCMLNLATCRMRLGTLLRSLVALLGAVRLLLAELLFGARRLGRERLCVRTKGADHKQLLSAKAKHLKAFTDGSVLASGACGLAVYYAEGHPLNFSGSFDPGAARAESNLAELAALFWVLHAHPRGQHLTVFSDSAHALRAVQAHSDEPERAPPRRRARGAPPPPRAAADPREACLTRAIGWLLRLRTAQTCFFKVGAHKGFKQNEVADALAQRAAERGPRCDVPLAASAVGLARLVLRFLLAQDELDGGAPAAAGGGAARRRRDGGAIRKPQPTGDSLELTPLLALDCEMVGCGPWGADSRLASVAVVNAFGNQVYFSYCTPARKVTDYRTPFSGITAELLEGAPPAAEVQREVAALLADRLIVGHSLENDFNALGFWPPQRLTRDTARDVPRLLSRKGRPRKLRRIAWEFLGLTIQDSEAGHSPIEDAQAALLLYQRYEAAFEARAAQRQEEVDARAQVAAGRAKAD